MRPRRTPTAGRPGCATCPAPAPARRRSSCRPASARTRSAGTGTGSASIRASSGTDSSARSIGAPDEPRRSRDSGACSTSAIAEIGVPASSPRSSPNCHWRPINHSGSPSSVCRPAVRSDVSASGSRRDQVTAEGSLASSTSSSAFGRSQIGSLIGAPSHRCERPSASEGAATRRPAWPGNAMTRHGLPRIPVGTMPSPAACAAVTSPVNDTDATSRV